MVTKKQPNILDKPKASQGGKTQQGGGGGGVSQDVDVRKLTVRFKFGYSTLIIQIFLI